MRAYDESLLAAVRQRASAVASRVREADGDVAAEDLQELERLARIVELRKRLSLTRRLRWPVLAALLLTVLIGSAMAFGRTDRTEIELDLTAEELSFELAADQVLFEGMSVRELGIAGATRTELPGQLQATPGDIPVRIEASSSNGRTGVLRLGALLAAAGTKVRLRHAGAPSRYRLTLSGPASALQIDLHGPVRIIPAGHGSASEDFPVPRSIHVEWGPDELDLDLLLPTAQAKLAPELKISKLVLFRIDELVTPAGTTVRQPSTILSGDLYFESLDGRSLRLRAGEQLRFAVVEGVLDRLVLGEQDLALRFHGQVRGMATGSAEEPRSLMPTWLEWLRARQGLLLVWGSTLYVVGLVAGVLRWLEVEQ
jgi:hypothetical protein